MSTTNSVANAKIFSHRALDYVVNGTTRRGCFIDYKSYDGDHHRIGRIIAAPRDVRTSVLRILDKDSDIPYIMSSYRGTLNDDEFICRLDRDIRGFVKVSLRRSMVYFTAPRSLSGETDELIFETRGIPCTLELNSMAGSTIDGEASTVAPITVIGNSEERLLEEL